MRRKKKYLMVDNYMLDNVLIGTDKKLPDDITLKNAVMLMTCVAKDGENLYIHLFLEEAFYNE